MSERNLAAAAAWLDESLIEHNPNIAAGKKGYVAYFGERWKDGSRPAAAGPVNPLVLAVAEGDKVVLVFKRPAQDPSEPTKMVDSFWFDAYRVEKGKITEHWDSAIRRAPTVTTMPVTPGTEATK
jgi:predicted SnoaL-like aldol condensation-catalyzing enzyme